MSQCPAVKARSRAPNDRSSRGTGSGPSSDRGGGADARSGAGGRARDAAVVDLGTAGGSSRAVEGRWCRG